jgi:protein-disulfide isomerase
MIVRVALTVVLLALASAALAQQFGAAQFPIKAKDGKPIVNHAVTAAQMAKVAGLPGLVPVGKPKGDVTLYQFSDLNCPFCREASRDVHDLVRADRMLRLVYVPYPTLSAQSVEGARVELALREIATPQQFLEFHRRVYSGRGIIDGARALEAAREMGFDLQKVVEIANARHVTETMTRHARLGTELKLLATPSYVIQGVAVVGHPGLETLRGLVRSVRACKKAIC